MSEDEPEFIPCAGCGVEVLTWWAANGGGLLRGEYVLVGDTIWHPRCWDEQLERSLP